jgi:CMP-N-acetylneuraminic acid synthetase
MSAGGALAVMPARGGSRRVPRKNIRLADALVGRS